MQDRTYWRGQSDRRLIEEGYESNHELCIALAERLAEAEEVTDYRVGEAMDRARDFEIDINRLEDKLYVAERARERLESIIDGMADEIAQLRSDR
jgi:hypothetical protein